MHFAFAEPITINAGITPSTGGPAGVVVAGVIVVASLSYEVVTHWNEIKSFASSVGSAVASTAKIASAATSVPN